MTLVPHSESAVRAWSGEEKYRAILSISEAANAHLDLSAFLDTVALALEDLVSIDNVGVLGYEDAVAKSISGRVRATPRRSDEPEGAYLDRVLSDPTLRQLVTSEMRKSLELLNNESAPVVIDDVLREPRFPVK